MSNKGSYYTLVFFCSCLWSIGSWAQETGEVKTERPPASTIQLQTTAVKGSRELPKVLVIVPWKSADAPGPGGRPLASLVEEALTPLDPAVFRRQLEYYTKLKSAATATSQARESTQE